MRVMIIWIVTIGAVVLLLFILDRLALWIEAKGWLYYRKTKHKAKGSLGDAFLEIQSMIEPGKRHVLEEKKREKREESESGDPPIAGKNGRQG